jgi:hypothetical protein
MFFIGFCSTSLNISSRTFSKHLWADKKLGFLEAEERLGAELFEPSQPSSTEPS